MELDWRDMPSEEARLENYRFLAKHWTGETVKVELVDSLSFNQDPLKVFAQVFFDGAQFAIELRRNLALHQECEIFLHEVGHLIAGHVPRTIPTPESMAKLNRLDRGEASKEYAERIHTKEREADRIASRLLKG